MSLHTLATHLQSAGRGDDKVLVHMTPGEVSGLQSLAMAHGGSLTINPETGLPEAGFLSGILPMIAGFALNAMVPGLGAVGSGLLVGGAGAVATGSLSKGLMMGLGAYGGAGLGAGLLGGEAAAAGLGAAGAAGAGGIAPMASAGALPGVVGGAGAMAPAVGGAAGTLAGATPGLTAATTGAGYSGMIPQATQLPINAANAGNAFMPTTTGAPVVATAPQNIAGPASSVEAATSGWDKFKSLPGKAYDLMTGTGPEADKAREEFYKQNKKYLIAGGLGVLGASREDPRMAREPSYAVSNYDWNTRTYSPSAREPGGTSERMYYAANGGLMELPVEKMSQQNASMDNTRYPMAMQNTPTYAIPSQRPISQNVISSSTDSSVSPYTGEQVGMASGGVVALAGGTTPAKLTPQEQAYINEENWLKTGIKPYDLSAIKEPKGGWTAANTVATYGAALNKEKAELINTENRLKQYIDPKTGAPKPGYDNVVNLLQEQIQEQRNNLIDAVNTVYEKIPKTNIDFSDPKKAGLQNTNQTNEYNAINSLLNNYINPTSLKGTDLATDYLNKLNAEKVQKDEAAKYVSLAPTLTQLAEYTGKNAQGKNIEGGLSDITKGWDAETSRQTQDVTKLKTALINAGLMDKNGNLTPAAQQYSGLTGIVQSALDKQAQEAETALGARNTALQDFGTSTARQSSGIGTRYINAVTAAQAAQQSAAQQNPLLGNYSGVVSQAANTATPTMGLTGKGTLSTIALINPNKVTMKSCRPITWSNNSAND